MLQDWSMSLHPTPIGQIPTETLRIACTAFPRGTVVTRLRDEFNILYEDEDFRPVYPSRGQPGLAPWRLALVTVLQFLEHLSDRQAADAVRARIGWKHALRPELTDPGFHFSVLTEFPTRLVVGNAEHLLLDVMLERFKARGLVEARGKQRTDSTHVLAAVDDLPPLELVVETLRAALDDLAAIAPDRLRAVARPVWFEHYSRRIEAYRLPRGQDKRVALALEIGADGFLLLDALDDPTAPAAAHELPMVKTPCHVWRMHDAREDSKLRLRSIAELPPVAERMQSPYDPQAQFSMKRHLGWTGYKVHVTEACEDDAAHLITHVKTCPSMRPDMTSTAEIHESLVAKGRFPAKHFVDSGYVDAELLASSQRKHGVSLEGPVRGISRRVGHGCEMRYFGVDQDREQVTCPHGKTSVSWHTIRAAHPCPVQRRGLQTVPCENRIHVDDKRAPLCAFSSARRIRGAECGMNSDDRSSMAGALPEAGWSGGHPLAGRAQLRHAPQSLYRSRQDQSSTGLHGDRNKRLENGALA